MAVSRLSCKGVRRYRHNSKAMTISGDPAHGGSYTLASAGPDEPTVNAGFDVSRTFVGFVHDIAPVRNVSVMLESHASSADEKRSIWSQISSSILTMLSTRSSESETSVVLVIAKLPSREKVHRQTLQHNAGRLRKPGCNGIVGGAGGGASKCDRHWERCPLIPKLEGPVPSRTPGSNWVTSEPSIFRNELSKKLEKSSGNGCTFSLMSAETPSHGKR
jgi:hypothetical protein